MASIYTNFSDNNWSNIQSAGDYEVGMRFQVGDGYQADALRWYAITTSASDKPSHLKLWDTVSQSAVVSITTIPTPTSTGWQELGFTPSYALVGGREYRVSYDTLTNQHFARYELGNLPSPDTGIQIFTSNPRCYANANTYPSTVAAQFLQAADVVVSGYQQPQSYEPATVGDVANIAASYLSVSDASGNTDSIPYMTRQELATVDGNVDDIKTSVGTDLVGDVAAVASDVGDILTSVGSGLAGKVDDIKTSVGAGLNTAVTALKSSWDFWRGAASTAWDDVASGLQAGADFWGQIGTYTGWTALSTASKLVGFLGGLMKGGSIPSTGWTNTASTTWTGGIAWAEPADLYIITITTAPGAAGSTVTEGLTMYRRAGWWAPLNGTQVGERQYLDWETNEVHILPQQLPGIELHYGPGWEGTIDAWVFTG